MQNSFLFTQDIPNYDMLEQIFFFLRVFQQCTDLKKLIFKIQFVIFHGGLMT